VLLARALVHAPLALLLDEPAAGLDVVARARLLRTLRRLAAEGVTLLLVTHHAEELLPEIGHVVLLRAGRVVADGPRAEVLTGPLLSLAFGAPLRFVDGEVPDFVLQAESAGA
jgi:iron complex transport system ATP-binding protein